MSFTWKRKLTTILLVFIVIGILIATARERSQNGRSDPPPAPADDGLGPVVVYYFHGYQRCSSCQRAEKRLRAALQSAYPSEMKNGRVAIRRVNVENAANASIVERFHVSARFPVVSDEQQGEGPWVNLDRAPSPELLREIIDPMLKRRGTDPVRKQASHE